LRRSNLHRRHLSNGKRTSTLMHQNKTIAGQWFIPRKLERAGIVAKILEAGYLAATGIWVIFYYSFHIWWGLFQPFSIRYLFAMKFHAFRQLKNSLRIKIGHSWQPYHYFGQLKSIQDKWQGSTNIKLQVVTAFEIFVKISSQSLLAVSRGSSRFQEAIF